MTYNVIIIIDCTHDTAICQKLTDSYSTCGQLDSFTWHVRDDPRSGAVVIYNGGDKRADCRTTTGGKETWISFECNPDVYVYLLLLLLQ